jgi:AbrB family looped-hinge helix DNA binding protein
MYSKVTRHGQITLPASVRKQLGVEEGDIIEIEVVDDRATLVPKKLVDKGQAYFWTREWQEGEREAETDIKSGRVRVYDSAKELIQELE